MRDDSDLRALFRKQRGEDQSRAPGFGDVVARGRNRARDPWIGLRPQWAIAALVLLTVGVFVTLRQRERIGEGAVQGLTSELTSKVWRAPTDFLLDLPASDLTRTVPAIGAPVKLDATLRDIKPRDTNAVRTRRNES